jgi:HD superfamily phosphohydrolase YqeK
LHDILKTGSAHAERGAAFLAENGFPEVAEVVRGHTDLPSSASAETEILYLADKIVSGTEFVSLEEREKRVRKKFLSDETAMKAALRRMKLAFDVREKVERVTGIPLLSDRVPRP